MNSDPTFTILNMEQGQEVVNDLYKRLLDELVENFSLRVQLDKCQTNLAIIEACNRMIR